MHQEAQTDAEAFLADPDGSVWIGTALGLDAETLENLGKQGDLEGGRQAWITLTRTSEEVLRVLAQYAPS